MSRKKQNLIDRFKKLTLWNKLGVIAALLTMISVGTWFTPKKWIWNSVKNSPGSMVYQSEGDINITYQSNFYNKDNDIIADFKDIEVLDNKIIDASKGYMKIRVSKEYLNTEFDRPVTLKYEARKYQPVLLTFTNHETKGAGIIVSSPERVGNAEIFLYECFKFIGFGKRTHTSDLVFKLYYNDYCAYFVTESGTFQYERAQRLEWGKNTLIGYFNKNDPRNKNASKDFSDLEKYFKKYY
ncbi:MAG: hypothetical protein JW828_15840 [Sedimentisphaerales bacterium]|nr:hypothetical protein [Sedimentisphaerales bacterium]